MARHPVFRFPAWLRAVAFFSAMASAGSTALAESAKPTARSFEIRRATGPIEIDGVLDEAAWSDALTFDVPYEWSPGDNVEPPVRTDFLATYDNDKLYVAWRCHDPDPGRIRAHLMDRDSIDTFVQDDHVVLLVDTFNDERRAFQFRVNPLGVEADAFNSENEGIEDWAFDLLWDAAGRINAEGYVVEAAIPFDQLRFPAGGERMTWGFDVGRSYPRNVRHRMSSYPRDRDRSCLACQFDKVTGFEGLVPGRNLEVTPTLTGNHTDRLDAYPEGKLVKDDEEAEPGVSLRWGLTPNLTLSAALNPDFSQVEADVAQLEVNTRFALFYPEKRPFFLEGANFFSTPLRAVFTRTVVDPDWGLKLTGKQGRNVLGVFVAEDAAPGLIFPANQGSRRGFLDRQVTTGVVRYGRDVAGTSNVGFLYAGRRGDDYSNDVYGVDAFWRLSDTKTVSFQALGSETLYPEAIADLFGQSQERFSGSAVRLGFDHAGRHWISSLTYRDLAPGFRADTGFIPQVDLRRSSLFLVRRFWGEEDDRLDRVDVGFSATRSEEHGGRVTDERLELFMNFAGPLQSTFEVGVVPRNERLGEVFHTDLLSGWLFGQMQPNGTLKLSLFSQFGDDIDLASNQVADALLVNPAIEMKLGRHFNLSFDHTFQSLKRDGTDILTANLSQAKIVYNLNVRTFVRAIVQYLDLDLEQEKEKTLFTQFLFSYKINARTVVFVGYSDNQLGLDDIRLIRTDRTFFLKLGYAWTL